MKKFFLTTVLLFITLLNAACLGDNPGEVYFNAFTKDGSGHYTVDALYKTTNYGQTATLVAENFNATIFKDKAPGVFYKIPLGSLSLYISQDTCRTWQWQSVLDSGGESFKTGIFAGECNDANRTSSDYGKTWTIRTYNGLSGGAYSWCLGLESGEMYAYMYNQKLYRSTDYGDNFTMINDTLYLGDGGLGRGWVAGELFLGKTSNRKIYRSFDYGQTFAYSYTSLDFWHGIRSGQTIKGSIPNEIIAYTISRSPSMIYNDMEIKFYHSYDLYQTIDSVTTNYNVGIEDNESQLPNYKLNNFPNPFNNSTVVKFALAQEENVKIDIYNTQGEVVRTLHYGFMQAGNHSINFNATGLNSGMYYIRLQAKSSAQTIKCLFLK